jgi:hypothetical protein
MAKTPMAEGLLRSIEADAEEYFDGGRTSNLWDMALTISVIVTSLIAAIVASLDTYRWIRIGIATLPAAIASIQKITDVKSRSNWYFLYAARLRALAVSLEFALEPNVEEFAKKKAAIDLAMEKAWGGIGRKGSASIAASASKH